MYKDFKCPNGLALEDCRHIPQLLNNLSNYFKGKAASRVENNRKQDSLEQPVAHQNTNQTALRQKQKTRG